VRASLWEPARAAKRDLLGGRKVALESMPVRILILLLIIARPALSGERAYERLPSALALRADIARLGAPAVLKKLWENDRVFDELVAKIGSGNRNWIDVAIALRQISDAGASESFDYAFSLALARAPAFVIPLLSYDGGRDPSFDIVCSGAMIIEPPPGVYEHWLIRAKKALEAFRPASPSVAKARHICLKIVHASIVKSK
jgi:hypothetical protein